MVTLIGLPAQPVRLQVQVDEQGRVRDIVVRSSSGSADLDRWVVDNVQRRQFTPGLVDGVPVAMAHDETVQIHLPTGILHGHEVGTTRTICGQSLRELWVWPGLAWPDDLAEGALCQGCLRTHASG